MKEKSEKYNQVLTLIKKSKPVLKNTDEIENEVIKRISVERSQGYRLSDIADVIFGWVYIGWVRRTLVTASVALVLFFAFQQVVMMRQISYLSRQGILIKGESLSSASYDFEKGLLLYRLSGKKLPSGMITIPEKTMNQLLDSVNLLQSEYRELMKLIREDPELRKLIEEKLDEKVRSKTKL
jgi:hypothetical protein